MNNNNSKDKCIYSNDIPQRYSWVCFRTCHIYLIVAILFFLCKQTILKILGGFMLGLYLTSFMYWKDPNDHSVAHRVDKVMVYAAIIFSTYAMYYTSTLVLTIWLVIISLCGIVYTVNEVLYHYQVCVPNNILKSNPEYEIPNKQTGARYFSLEPTWCQTEEREYAYYRYTLTHGIGVHLLTGGIAGLSIAFICLFHYQ